MNALEVLFKIAQRNPVEAFALLTLLGGIVRAALKKRGSQSALERMSEKKPDGGPGRTGESELETRVRRNFEEMMRRRTAAPPVSPPPLPVRPVAPAAKAQRKPAPRAPVDYDRMVKPEPTRIEARSEPTRVAAKVAKKKKPLAVARHAPTAASAGRVQQSHKRPFARVLDADLDLNALRRAVLTREILDPPLALRK